MNTEVAIIQNEREFAAIEEEWEELYAGAPLATPFQSWAWLYSWWEFYGKDYELWLIAVRNDRGLLVGVAPLMLERTVGFGRLLFVGTGFTDHLDVLAREGWEGPVSEALARALERKRSWGLVDLQQLRPGAAAWGLLRWWDGPLLSVWQDGFPVLDVRPWDELLMSRSKNLRSTVRRTLRRAEADGVSRKLTSVEDAERAATRLVTLHRELWQERDIGSEHLTRRFESCVIAVAKRLIAREVGGITEFWRDGEVIVSDFWVCGHDFLGTYMLGASQEALQRYQWSSLYIWDAVTIAESKDKNRIDLLRGEEPYKLRWSSEIIPNHRLILGRNWTTWAPYAGYHFVYSKARRYANSERAPRWIKSAAGTYRVLQRQADRFAGNGKRT